MPMPSVYVTRFFQLITARRFAEAERVLLRLRKKVPRTEWNRGYLRALKGMLLTQKNNDDRYNFLSNIDQKNQDELQEYRREFWRHARNKLHADYDRGYFAAWASYMRVLSKLEFAADKTKSKIHETEEVKTEEKTEKKMTEETKEKAVVKKRKKAEKKIEAETERKEIVEVKRTERVQPGQSTLFDFPE